MIYNCLTRPLHSSHLNRWIHYECHWWISGGKEEKGLIEAAIKFEKSQRRQNQMIKIKRLQAKMRKLAKELERETKVLEKMM